MNYLRFSIILAIVFLCSTAMADTVGFGGGQVRPHNGNDDWSLDTGYVLTLSYDKDIFDYKWLNFDMGMAYYRLEYQKSYRPDGRSSHAEKKKNVSNDYFDIHARTQLDITKYVRPFFELGVGTDSDEAYYSGGGGLNFPIYKEWSMDVAYKEAETFDGEKLYRMTLLSIRYGW